MNSKLKNLWLAAHAAISTQDSPYIFIGDKAFGDAFTVIHTLRYVYGCFGLPEPLHAPTEEEINGYVTSNN